MGQNTMNFRRFLAILLAALVALSYLPAVSAAEPALTEHQTEQMFTVDVTGGTVTKGTADTDGRYPFGSEITVTADDIAGTFLGWFENDVLQSENTSYTFILENNRNLEARYIPYTDFLTIEREAGDNLTASFASYADLPWLTVIPEEPEEPYLRSGGITHEQVSNLALNVSSDLPKCLVFDWRVSSEEAVSEYKGDNLYLTLDNGESIAISGETQWETKTLLLPPVKEGHSIAWDYVKDYSIDKYNDCGYLKNLRLESVKKTLTVNGGAVTKDTAEPDGRYLFGTEITVTANPPGSGQFFGGWYDEKDRMVSADAVYTFAIEYNRTLTAKYSTYADFLTGADGDGVNSAVFESGGAQPWESTPDELDGSLCLRSGSIQDSETSSLSLKLNLTRSYRLSFHWRAWSEANYDKLKLLLDGKELKAISGNPGWLSETVLVPRGEHTIEWRFEKDGSEFVYPDCGYLKNLLLAPVPEVTVSARPDDPAHGSVTPETGLYPEGGSAEFIAVPAKGYYLQYWQDSKGNKVTERPTMTVPAIADTYTAVFGVLDQDYSPLIASGSDPLTLETWGCIWTMQPDGSARSGPLVEHKRSALRTVVTVPPGGRKALLFDWKVSSPASERILILYLDGKEYTEISGTGSGWQNFGMILQEGTHTVEWIYQKSSHSRMAEAEAGAELAAERPEDCGWVKNICFKTPGLYRVKPVGNAMQGRVRLDWSSESSADDGRYYEGTLISFEASPKAGYYFKGWKDSAGNMVSTNSYFSFVVSGDVEYTAVFELTGSDYLDIVKEDSRADFDFYSGWNGAWTVDGGVARSGGVASILGATVEVPYGEKRLLTFEWKVSCDTYYKDDGLEFALNGTTKYSISAVDGGWRRYAIVLDAGTNSIEWTYAGDAPYPDGENCGWVRNVSLSAPGTGTITIGTAAGGSGSSETPEEDWPLPEGTEVRLTAVPDPGYACVGWKDEAGEMVSEWPEFMACVCGDMTYTPVFKKESASYDAAAGRAVITSGQEYDSSPAVVLAAYDSRGILTSHTVMDLDWLPAGRIRIPAPLEFQPKAGETVKVLVWDDLNSMKPLFGNPEP